MVIDNNNLELENIIRKFIDMDYIERTQKDVLRV